MIDEKVASLRGGRRLVEGARNAPPLVSVIIVVLRARAELIPLMESIFPFQSDSMEVIVIDGGSKDGTVELLREWNDKIDYWISEPDTGIYDAMNKGLAAASGEYILHLNGGDRLRRIPHDELRQCLADGIAVACFAVKMAGFGIHRPRTGFLMRFANQWHHQGTFYRRTTHLGYDTQYPIYGDFDLNQRMTKARMPVRLFNLVVAEQVTVGISGNRQTDKEQYLIVKRNFGLGYVWLAVIWHFVSPTFPTIKRLLKRD